jgi:cell pole-organizing protein PopZ
MSQAAKAQEPSMEEILASIRRIIADDETTKPPPAAAPQPAPPVAGPPAAPEPAREAPPELAREVAPEPAAMSQHDIDAMLAGFDGPAPASTSAATPEQSDDVLELTAAMEAPGETVAAPAFRTVEASPDVVFADSEPEPEPVRAHPREIEAVRRHGDEVEEQPLLSNHATAAVTAAFGTLAHTVLTQNARTLDDLVQEMLRPMLKSWLDDNLPTIVERLVRAEIERVSRGRG